MLQLRVTAQFYFGSKGTYILKAWGQADHPKVWREASGSILAPLFMFFFLPLSLSYVNCASQEGCLFYLRFLLQSSDLSLFYSWAFPFFIFQPPPFWTPFSYSRTSLVAQTVKRLSTMRETRVQALVGKIPWRRKWQPTPVLLPGKSHGQRSLLDYSLWSRRVRHDWATSLSLSLSYST